MKDIISAEEFEENLINADENVDKFGHDLHMTESENLLFYSMMTAVSTYFSGMVLDYATEHVRRWYIYSQMHDRKTEFGRIPVPDIEQDDWMELFELSQDVVQDLFERYSKGKPKTDGWPVETYMEVFEKSLYLITSVISRSADPEEALKIAVDQITELWDFIEKHCKVEYDGGDEGSD